MSKSRYTSFTIISLVLMFEKTAYEWWIPKTRFIDFLVFVMYIFAIWLFYESCEEKEKKDL
ncbi:hypothetical protein HF295_04455 [Hujiaoplasma nucleasis]|uniref:Uncharacterized protein n=1 Tax=Hujiaoplasma nucleasis TaxID=2725268 RepID=A0A7L6N3M6_9MOLU|nr:hypothetical protein [Hujiaoplasma nucleasis]QLY40151.1 hypothetical protein HF295_04455 [Hujiaoplasma nucleasis]